MNKNLQLYFDSFKLGKLFAYTFLIDLVSLSLIIFVFTWFSTYVQERSLEVMQGRTVTEIQQMVATLNPEQLAPFVTMLKSFLIISVTGLLLLIIGSVMLFSFSQASIWNFLLGKKVTSKNYWRWNALNLSLLMPLFLFLMILLLVRVSLSLLLDLPAKLAPYFYLTHTTIMENIRLIVDGAGIFLVIVLFIVIAFLIYFQFVKSYRIWDSLGAGFSRFKKQWKKILFLAFLATVSALIITVILLPIKQALIFYPFLSTLLNVVLASFFLAWLRYYLYSAVLHGDQ